MIRIVLLGRTGNNLFQYALGRLLSEKHGVPLVLDGSWYDEAGWREVSHLLKLPLKARVVRRFSPLARALRNLGGGHYWQYRGVPFLREPEDDQSHDPRFSDAPADCVLFGYFQSAAYFQSIEEKLRVELLSLLELGSGVKDFGETVHPTTVAVHVRRGDYLQHSMLQVCGEEYYRNAIQRMRETIPEAKFLIFSDDPEWCREQFTEPGQQVVDTHAGGMNPLHDLHLMSRAAHHIICNSSYSWWAAWLGKKPGQLVLMPNRWFAGNVKAPLAEKNPGNWIVIPTGI